ncbi:tyrosine-protein phosphatase [Kitasatospora atroaurantiaca]|uniref:Protein-tyrosine phosphatase n=1 Tax=Kitasatospora atroaurantiaca TaxID=285545 RepID=A0A561EK24_9ACTN|nr:tyrosine-protein phosphatase [Kitasatospora atroaurantiaca]TWE15973.1 protein-tyrosine phosphatase [Kitasatospora atroaurantiaca]
MPSSQAVESVTVANLRDLGGIPLPDGGRVRPGTVFRSGQLDRLDLAGEPAFAALRLRTVVDLRTEYERTARPDRMPGGAHLLVADVMADSAGSGAASRLGAAMADPALANRTFDGRRAQQALMDDYRAFVTSASARAAYKQLLTAVARPEGGPLLFHCTAGKDRTGWGATLILLLLGADTRTVEAEYLSVAPAVKAAFAPVIEAFIRAGGNPEIAEAILTVRPAYLAAALDTMTDLWGDAESYARAGLGLKDETLDALRARLIA